LQVDTWDRGFSYSYDAPLDMRMDPDQDLTAADVVNTWDERRLARLLRHYGEERFANVIARAIVRRRAEAELATTQELVDVIKAAVPAPARFAGGHPAKRSFQALRIAVNDELDQLDRALPLAWTALRRGGPIGAIAPPAPQVVPRVPRRVSGPARGRRLERGRATLGARALAWLRTLPDHTIVDRLTRGRLWIGLIACLLLGLVGMQVALLKLNAG